MKVKVLVYGFYHQGNNGNQGNLGDDLFIDAFRYLFPNLHLVFTDHIKDTHLKDIDAVFFGGGSFLLGTPKISSSALEIIKQKKIFYIGVGVEDHIHPIHMDLMRRAQLLAIRTVGQLDRVKTINDNAILIPDLVYCLPSSSGRSQSKSLLIIPNLYVVPKQQDANWKHAAWVYFKSEFCQFLDFLVDSEYIPHLFAMCLANKEDDRWAVAELVSGMQNRDNAYILQPKIQGMQQITKLFKDHSLVITQRFHGIVLAEICQVPYIAIHHHDKLKKQPNNVGHFLPYYGISKDQLIEAFHSSLAQDNVPIPPVQLSLFADLVKKVAQLL